MKSSILYSIKIDIAQMYLKFGEYAYIQSLDWMLIAYMDKPIQDQSFYEEALVQNSISATQVYPWR